MEKIKKWLENYWYHYKGMTLIALFIAFALIVGVTQCVRKVEEDYLVTFAFKRFVPDEVISAAEDYFERYGEDVNGDGQVKVRIMDVSTYSGQDKGSQKASSQQLMGEAIRGECIIYIVDDVFYDTIKDKVVKFEKYDKFSDKEGTAFDFSNTKLAEYINENSPYEFITTSAYITKREVGDQSPQNTKQSNEYACRMLDKIIKDLA